ncbi:MAG: hypothetical protein JJE55_07790 [Flavobacteriaceae bacterium]|nr:hypothetical protein [Flavobacteriaceae bacterium]
MNKKQKKIIAREFLILIGTGILFIIIYFMWFQLHGFNIEKENRIEVKVSDTFNKEPFISLERFVNSYEEDDAIFAASTWESRMAEFPELKKYEEQSLKDYVATVKSEKYKNELILNSKFPEFGFTDKGLPESSNQNVYFNQINELEKTKKSFFNKDITRDKIYNLLYILIFITFILRYLIYCVKWSIKQVRQ